MPPVHRRQIRPTHSSQPPPPFSRDRGRWDRWSCSKPRWASLAPFRTAAESGGEGFVAPEGELGLTWNPQEGDGKERKKIATNPAPAHGRLEEKRPGFASPRGEFRNWPGWIRTTTAGSKDRCPAIRRRAIRNRGTGRGQGKNGRFPVLTPSRPSWPVPIIPVNRSALTGHSSTPGPGIGSEDSSRVWVRMNRVSGNSS